MSGGPGGSAAEPQPESAEPSIHEDNTRPPGAALRKVAHFVAHIGPQAPRHHPLVDKIEPRHLDKVLDILLEYASENMRGRREGRRLRTAVSLSGLAAFTAITLYLAPEHGDIYLEILKIVGAFAAGAAGGYGFKAYRDEQRF